MVNKDIIRKPENNMFCLYFFKGKVTLYEFEYTLESVKLEPDLIYFYKKEKFLIIKAPILFFFFLRGIYLESPFK